METPRRRKGAVQQAGVQVRTTVVLQELLLRESTFPEPGLGAAFLPVPWHLSAPCLQVGGSRTRPRAPKWRASVGRDGLCPSGTRALVPMARPWWEGGALELYVQKIGDPWMQGGRGTLGWRVWGAPRERG